jgi:hypothetical protein
VLPKVSAALGRNFEDEDTNIAGLFEGESTSKLGPSKMNRFKRREEKTYHNSHWISRMALPLSDLTAGDQRRNSEQHSRESQSSTILLT